MADSLLVVIDMQNIFADAGSEWATPGFAEIVPTIKRLTEAFGGHSEKFDSPRVVFTRFVVPEEPSDAWVEYYRAWPFALDAPTRSYELVEPFAGRATLDATTFGKWGAVARHVKPGGTVYLAGVSTDCCVLSTALAAVDAGAHVRVVSDATAGPSHEAALAVMRLYGPQLRVVTAEEATAAAVARGGEQ